MERARLTYKLAQMKEAEGKLDEASTIMQDLQVRNACHSTARDTTFVVFQIETFGSMDRQEKVELLLEQMRLCLAQKDYVRTQIISRKISVKFFDDESIKVRISGSLQCRESSALQNISLITGPAAEAEILSTDDRVGPARLELLGYLPPFYGRLQDADDYSRPYEIGGSKSHESSCAA